MKRDIRYSKIFKTISNKKGQLSIFLGLGLMSVMVLLAFVINVGMFVKAKINLQNAVDAAAWSGAAVQARQLSRIGYLNWEIRNTYKEWMFKYYVLGQMGIEKTTVPNLPSRMDFRAVPFINASNNNPNLAQFQDPNAFDKFNVPSICIHHGTGNNICGLASLPGLPRFGSIGLSSISHSIESTLSALAKAKANDCAQRTVVNYKAAQTWAYGTGISSSDTTKFPEIASNRPGAWLRAIEISLRIRNLEYVLNSPPLAKIDKTVIQNLTKDYLHERSFKAYLSGFRNLGGGVLKDPQGGDELSSTFVLEELAPKSTTVTANDLSGYLIPSNSPGLKKYYADLIINPVNFVTFFTFFAARTNTISSVPMEAACSGTKTALPIPGYIMGFYKNPNILTYYAVKGSADYYGLFNPFGKSIKIKAYATAKPFGGRIGPVLFKTSSQSVSGRPKISSSFASRLDVGPYQLGMPIPMGGSSSINFWATNSDPIGGNPNTGSVKFVIPNMIYSYPNNPTSLGANTIETLQKLMLATSTTTTNRGLYDGNQFKQLRDNLQTSASSNILTDQNIMESIQNVRAPTTYDILNYLIPITNTDAINNTSTSENAPNAISIVNNNISSYSFYAPLYGANTLFSGITEINLSLHDYFTHLQDSIKSITDALKTSSIDIKNMPAAAGSAATYQDAADSIWKSNFKIECSGKTNTSGVSLSGQLFQFFEGPSTTGCGITPLQTQISNYILNNPNQNFQQNFSDLYINKNSLPLNSAFSPGPRQGATISGKLLKPYGQGSPLVAKRNFYSTKLIQTSKVVLAGSELHTYGERKAIIIEKNKLEGSLNIGQTNIKNMLNANDLKEFGKLFY